MQETGVTEFNAKQGIIEGYEVTIDTESETTAEEENTEDSSVNSTHTDVVLGEDEYKGDEEETTEEDTKEDLGLTQEEQDLATQIANQIMQEHPEWVSGGGTGGTQQGNYEHVGTEDNTANTPQIQFGQGDYSQLGDNVTVY